jgi:hypothetical protein
MRAYILLFAFVLFFPTASFCAPYCSQINTNFCALGNCTTHSVEF